MNSSTEGRLEVFISGKWGSVEVKSWSTYDARVTCRELGYPDAEENLGKSVFPQGSGLIWVLHGNCTGEEERLVQCLYIQSRKDSRVHEHDVGVKCKPGIF